MITGDSIVALSVHLPGEDTGSVGEETELDSSSEFRSPITSPCMERTIMPLSPITKQLSPRSQCSADECVLATKESNKENSQPFDTSGGGTCSVSSQTGILCARRLSISEGWSHSQRCTNCDSVDAVQQDAILSNGEVGDRSFAVLPSVEVAASDWSKTGQQDSAVIHSPLSYHSNCQCLATLPESQRCTTSRDSRDVVRCCPLASYGHKSPARVTPSHSQVRVKLWLKMFFFFAFFSVKKQALMWRQ